MQLPRGGIPNLPGREELSREDTLFEEVTQRSITSIGTRFPSGPLQQQTPVDHRRYRGDEVIVNKSRSGQSDQGSYKALYVFVEGSREGGKEITLHVCRRLS